MSCPAATALKKAAVAMAQNVPCETGEKRRLTLTIAQALAALPVPACEGCEVCGHVRGQQQTGPRSPTRIKLEQAEAHAATLPRLAELGESAHDHGNCALCDCIEAELTRLQARLAALEAKVEAVLDEALMGLIDVQDALNYFQKIRHILEPEEEER